MAPITVPDYICSLPWYDLEEVRPATDALWTAVADRLRRGGMRDVPETLDRATPLDRQWTSPRLLLSQACGYDAALAHPDRLRVVATPRYAAPGCEDLGYRSFVVLRRDSTAGSLASLRGARAAINDRTSHSGMNILRSLVAPLARAGRFFSEIVLTGGHVRSLERLASGEVDVAAVDCVTYELLRRHRPAALESTRILCSTPLYPAPPYVTGVDRTAHEVSQLREALAETLLDPRLAQTLETLLIRGAEPIPAQAYRPIATLEREALLLGCFEFPHRTPDLMPA